MTVKKNKILLKQMLKSNGHTATLCGIMLSS